MNEALRWFPPVVNIPKSSAEDTAWNVANAAGEKAQVPVPRGSYIAICTPSLHFNREPESVLPVKLHSR